MPQLPGYDKATAAEREEGIARTRALREAECSDTDRWANPELHHPVWAGRTAALARFVRPGERVFEFGAGVRSARAFLPENCSYVASDLTPHEPDTWIFDLNAFTLPPIKGFDLAFFSGVIEYVHSLPRLTIFLAEYFSSVVCSYSFLNLRSPELLDRRLYSGWFSDLSLNELVGLFKDAGYDEVAREAWEGQALFRFECRANTDGITPCER